MERDNDYDILYMGKAALELQGILPEQLEANDETIELARTFLDELEGDGDGEDMD